MALRVIKNTLTGEFLMIKQSNPRSRLHFKWSKGRVKDYILFTFDTLRLSLPESCSDQVKIRNLIGKLQDQGLKFNGEMTNLQLVTPEGVKVQMDACFGE